MSRMFVSTALLVPLVLLAGAVSRAQVPPDDIEADFDRNARRAAPRDAFPVLDHPPMVNAAEGSRSLRDGEWVIGVSLGGESKAYPVEVMGRHELGNDTCGGKPIAVSW